MSAKKRTKKYLVGVPIFKANEAKALGNDLAWDVLDILSEQGSDGYTVKEMREVFEKRGLDVGLSTLHLVMNNLLTHEFVNKSTISSEKRWGRPSLAERKSRESRKRGKVFYEGHDLGLSIEPEFEATLDQLLEKKFVQEYAIIKRSMVNLVGDIIEEYKTNKELAKYYPESNFCGECGSIHRAREFLLAICYDIVYNLQDSEEWKNLLRKQNFIKNLN